METFSPGDRVVAINTDLSGPICGPSQPALHPFRFPDGPLRQDVVYHVTAVKLSKDGFQGITLTGLRIFWGEQEIPWHGSRFRKVENLADHAPKKRRRKRPAPKLLAIH